MRTATFPTVVYPTTVSEGQGKCEYDGGNIRKEIIVSAWNWDQGSFVTVGSTLLGVNDNRFCGELNMAILYSPLADQVGLCHGLGRCAHRGTKGIDSQVECHRIGWQP